MKPIIDLVAGARPNFMKLAPVHRAIVELNQLTPRIIHTGQHYDSAMSRVFFDELGIPEPDKDLEVGSGLHGQQTARILERYEDHLLSERPAATVVFGDVNSTVACALAAAKEGVPIVHVEAGLRSFDRTMPEEINRVLTDSISDLLFVTESSGVVNLRNEGIDQEKVELVGNVMIDSLTRMLPAAKDRGTAGRLGLDERDFGLVTLHRPSNVDDPNVLERLIELLNDLSQELPLVFPVHPRTALAAERAGLAGLLRVGDSKLLCLEPQPYLDHLSLMSNAALVLTDSGGMQEETSVLGIPCLTMRENTERPITLERGTSRLVGNDPAMIRNAFEDAIAGRWPQGQDIPLWDGRAGDRIAEILGSQI